MALICVRVRSLPSNVRETHLESDWSDLNIADKGVLHLANKFFVFFKNNEDAEDAINRGFRFEHKDYTAKELRLVQTEESVNAGFQRKNNSPEISFVLAYNYDNTYKNIIIPKIEKKCIYREIYALGQITQKTDWRKPPLRK